METMERSFSNVSDEIRLASSNQASQLTLFRQFEESFENSSKTLSQVAGELGVTEAVAENAIRGRMDLTLTELRLLANTLEVVISYEIA